MLKHGLLWQVNDSGKCAILEMRSLEQITVMKVPALVRMAIIPFTPEALDRAARLAGTPKDKEPDVQKRIDAAAPLVAEVKVLCMHLIHCLLAAAHMASLQDVFVMLLACMQPSADASKGSICLCKSQFK